MSLQNAAATSQQAAPSEQVCPQCHTAMPVYSGYVTWCDHCGWNLQPYAPARSQNIVGSLYLSLGKRLSQQLFAQLSRDPSLKPGLSGAKVLAYILAALVHLFTIVLALLGVALLAIGWPHIAFIIMGGMCLAITWILRPRAPRFTRADDVVSRENFPALYKLADQVAAAVGAKPVDTIVIDADFNAAFGQVGWRRRPILYLGLPLLTILEPQEYVALLGHEIAHGVNGDPNRSFFIGTALNSLVTWYRILLPPRLWDRRAGLAGFAAIPLNLLLLGLANLVRWVIRLLLHLLWRDMQRAEYLADRLGAQVSGTAAALTTLDKLHFGNTFGLTVHIVSTLAVNRQKLNLFDELRRRVAAVPAHEIERIRRGMQMTGSRLDTTHPPTPYRIAVLQAHPTTNPAVVCTPAEFAQITQELATVQGKIQRELLDARYDSPHWY